MFNNTIKVNQNWKIFIRVSLKTIYSQNQLSNVTHLGHFENGIYRVFESDEETLAI